jgi:hypothetical protein
VLGEVFQFNPSLIAVGIMASFVAKDGTPNKLASARITAITYIAETKFILRNWVVPFVSKRARAGMNTNYW